MGILIASDSEIHMNELTIKRTSASLPYGGRYRMIDFALSNLVNSGISTIGIVTRNNYNSLMDHLRMEPPGYSLRGDGKTVQEQQGHPRALRTAQHD